MSFSSRTPGLRRGWMSHAQLTGRVVVVVGLVAVVLAAPLLVATSLGAPFKFGALRSQGLASSGPTHANRHVDLALGLDTGAGACSSSYAMAILPSTALRCSERCAALALAVVYNALNFVSYTTC
jgi:hypothetical protein